MHAALTAWLLIVGPGNHNAITVSGIASGRINGVTPWGMRGNIHCLEYERAR